MPEKEETAEGRRGEGGETPFISCASNPACMESRLRRRRRRRCSPTSLGESPDSSAFSPSPYSLLCLSGEMGEGENMHYLLFMDLRAALWQTYSYLRLLLLPFFFASPPPSAKKKPFPPAPFFPSHFLRDVFISSSSSFLFPINVTERHQEREGSHILAALEEKKTFSLSLDPLSCTVPTVVSPLSLFSGRYNFRLALAYVRTSRWARVPPQKNRTSGLCTSRRRGAQKTLFRLSFLFFKCRRRGNRFEK